MTSMPCPSWRGFGRFVPSAYPVTVGERLHDVDETAPPRLARCFRGRS